MRRRERCPLAKATGKTKEIVVSVGEIERLIGEASSYIDTKQQYKIRDLLENAINKCQDIRDKFDPI